IFQAVMCATNSIMLWVFGRRWKAVACVTPARASLTEGPCQALPSKERRSRNRISRISVLMKNESLLLGQHATVDLQYLTRDVGRHVAGEEHTSLRDVFWPATALERNRVAPEL